MNAPGDEEGNAVAPLTERVRGMLDRHWTSAGYAAPNHDTYPWQWLWDSCFHSLIWLELGEEDRATTELTQVLDTQSDSGFVPHMNYQLEPSASEGFWGRRGTSSITQPPMYGHAVAAFAQSGIDVPDELVERSRRGLRFLLRTRARHESGLVTLCHPWESGADDSPRWDDACPGDWSPHLWWVHKRVLIDTIERSSDGSPLANPAFDVASVGFNALIVWNAKELVRVTGDAELRADAAELGELVDARWDPGRATWVDAGLASSGSGRIRTADALLPLLVTSDRARVDSVADQLTQPDQFGGSVGPPGVHRAEPVFDRSSYWRGPVWPQLAFLLWRGLRMHGRDRVADAMAAATVHGADISGLAEYWDPDSGTGLGAIPQSWTGLALLMAGS